jgi:aspartyl-tRNA(Asn)/glutamyl-tRNA(Gln) amidotransferase subunit B
MPVMPDEWRQRLGVLGLDRSQIDVLLESEIEFESAMFLNPIEDNLKDKDLAKFLANWNINVLIPLVRDGKVKLAAGKQVVLETSVYDLLKSNKLSSTNAKALFEELVAQEALPDNITQYAEGKGLLQESDEAAITAVVQRVITDNPKAAEDVRRGEAKAIGFLIGQVMKQSQGKANPQLAQQLIKKQLEITS